ncbi:MAG: histidine phosphatase family protein [Burkholderiaceae bacterium]
MKPRRRLLLMRHGAVNDFDAHGRSHSPDEVPLTTAGEAQARAAGQLLAGQPIDRVITSGLTRTRTAAALALAAGGIDVVPEHWGEIRGSRSAIANWNFYLAYRLFRIATILQDVYQRASAGMASSRNSLAAGKNARALAELGLTYAQKA